MLGLDNKPLSNKNPINQNKTISYERWSREKRQTKLRNNNLSGRISQTKLGINEEWDDENNRWTEINNFRHSE